MTGLALSADDRTAYSVAKDGSVFQLDVETLKRWAAHTLKRMPLMLGTPCPALCTRCCCSRSAASHPVKPPHLGEQLVTGRHGISAPGYAGLCWALGKRSGVRPAGKLNVCRLAPSTRFVAGGTEAAAAGKDAAPAADWVRRLPRGQARPIY